MISEHRVQELVSACIDPAAVCHIAIQLATASGNVVFFDSKGDRLLFLLVSQSFKPRQFYPDLRIYDTRKIDRAGSRGAL